VVKKLLLIFFLLSLFAGCGRPVPRDASSPGVLREETTARKEPTTGVTSTPPKTSVFRNQNASPGPRGIYAVTDRMVDAILAKPFVDGILIRAAWKWIQPKNETSYDWTSIDALLAQARAKGKKASIAIFPARNMVPDWVFAKGVEKWSGKAGTLANPMHAPFYELWFKFVKEFGARYDNNPSVSHVYICGGTGLLCGLRFIELPPGWNAGEVVENWKRVIDTYVQVFPSLPLGFEIHLTVGQGVTLADTMMAYINGKYGSKIGPFQEFLSATTPAGPLADMMKKWGPKGGKSWCGFQAVKPLGRTIDGGYVHGYNNFGCQYFEIYGIDLADSVYASVHQKWHEQLWK
jgi:hypothetical protein